MRSHPPRLALLAILLTAAACSTDYPAQKPLGETFPSVQGESLDGRSYQLPADSGPTPSLLLIGYEQDTQFDLDRWLLGLQQAEIEVAVFELPTIPGLMPGLFAGQIDDGMRSGIPEEDWAVVITIYDDAEKIARFTGNQNPLPGRVLLLDGEGRVAFFHDRGYSVRALMQMKEALAALAPDPHPGPLPG